MLPLTLSPHISGNDLHRLAHDSRCHPSVRMELQHNIELLRT